MNYKKYIVSFKSKIRLYQYHLLHKKAAINTLRGIESEKGVTDPKLIKLSNEYSNDVLGWSGYSPWLYVYSAIAESFKEGWIPDNYYGKVVIPTLKGDYRNISELNSLTNKIFRSNSFPDIAYYVNGLWLSKDHSILNNSQVKDVVFRDSDLIVFKIDNSVQGKGVFFFNKSEFSTDKIKLLGSGVVQEFIKQNKFFEEFASNSVATLRITTVIDDLGDISARASYLRIGRDKDTHVRSETAIKIPVNLKTGKLYDQGYTSGWNGIFKHPDTNIFFENKQVPSFFKCISHTVELHKKVPFVRVIGWDLTVDDNNNVKVMEWNGNHNGIKFTEATQGPCFSDLGWEKIKFNL